MLYILLAALLLLIAALLRRSQTAPTAARPAPPKPPALSEQTVDSLCAAVSALQALMGHPRLGGPGFLTLRLLPDGAAAAAAQYPNIHEVLYRRIVRRELSPEELLAEGFPPSLLALAPDFETESGGTVLLTAHVPLDPGAAWAAADFRQRQMVLNILAERLRERFPSLFVRCVGGELLLSPIQKPVQAF